MKQKKAQAFELFLVFSVLLLGCNVIFYAIKGNIDFSLNLQTPAKIIEMYNNADKFMLFARESGKLAITQAYYEMVKENKFAGNCIIQEGYIELCSISDTIDNDFATKISNNIAGYLNSYKDEQFKAVKYSVTISDDIVNFNAEKINLHTQTEKGFFPFDTVYSINTSFTINITEMGLDKMTKVVETSKNCFENRQNSDIFECMNQLKNFDPVLAQRDDKRFFDLTTKERFFYTQDGKPLFEKIAVKFFIKD